MVVPGSIYIRLYSRADILLAGSVWVYIRLYSRADILLTGNVWVYIRLYSRTDILLAGSVWVNIRLYSRADILLAGHVWVYIRLYSRADILLAGSDWSSYVVGKLDTSINVDSVVPSIRKISEAKLTEELKYASHLGLPAVMVNVRNI